MTHLFALALIATVSNTLNTVRVCIAYADQYTIDHALDGAFPTYVPTTKVVRACATTGMSLDDKVVYKAMRLVCRRAHSRDAIKACTPRNSAAKRAEIHARDEQRHLGRIAEKAVIHEAQQQGISVTTMLARKAQGSAARAVNAVRALARMVTPKKARTVKVVAPICSSKAATVPSVAQHDSLYQMIHVVHGTSGSVVADVRGEIKTSTTLLAIRKANNIAAKAAAWALRQERIAMRRERIARMCAKAWMDKGVWIDTFLVEACNDSDYGTREAAYTELLAIIGVAA